MLNYMKNVYRFNKTVILNALTAATYHAYLNDIYYFIFIFSGPPLISYLDNIAPVSRMAEGPIRIPIVDRYKVRNHICIKPLVWG